MVYSNNIEYTSLTYLELCAFGCDFQSREDADLEGALV